MKRDIEITIDSGPNIVMDRKYPSNTLAQLKQFVAEGKGNAVMEQEIKDRESGASVVRATPQILGGKVQAKVGRM